jgi:hypothetical protein
MKPLLNYNTIGTKNSRVQKGGFMLISAILAATLTACPQAPTQDQQISARGMTSPKDIMLHGIIAGSSFQSNQGFTLQNGSSIHANTGLVLNSRNIVLNGGQVSSTSVATCSDNSGQGFCLNGKPKFISPIVTVPKPDVSALKAKYTAVPVVTIQGSLNLNSSSEITNRFDNKIVLVKGSVNLNAVATIKNAVLIVEETLKSNKGMTLENTRIISKGAQFNQSTVLTNSRIITDEDLTFNGKLENTGISSVISSKNLIINQGVTSASGELAVISNQNITLNQSSSGKIAIWASGNITMNQVSSLEGSVVAGGKVMLNQGQTITKVSSHLNGDVLGGGEVPFGTREVGVLRRGQTWTTSFGVSITAPEGMIDPEAQIFVEVVDPANVGVKFEDSEFANEVKRISPYFRIGTIPSVGVYGGNNFVIGLPIPQGTNPIEAGIFSLFDGKYIGQPEKGLVWNPHITIIPSTELQAIGTDGGFSSEGTLYTATSYIVPLPRTQQSTRQANVQLQLTQTLDYSFNCSNVQWSIPSMRPVRCPTNATISEINTTLRNARINVIQSMNLGRTDEPRLEFNHFIVNANFRDCANGADAYYESRIKTIVLCVLANGNLKGANQESDVRHEVFHSVQAGIMDTEKDLKDYEFSAIESRWILESTAVTAQNSFDGTIRRDNQKFIQKRSINERFVQYFSKRESQVDNLPLYLTQDFWIFVAKKKSMSLESLKILFKTQLTAPINNLKSFFGSGTGNLDYTGGFTQAYWDWARNQGFEKQPNLGITWQQTCTTQDETLLPDYDNSASKQVSVATLILPQPGNIVDGSSTISDGIAPLETRAVVVQFNGIPLKTKFKLSVTSSDGRARFLRWRWYEIPATRPSSKTFCKDKNQDNTVVEYTHNKVGTKFLLLVTNLNTTENINIDATNNRDLQNPIAAKFKVQPETAKIDVPSSIILTGTKDSYTNTVPLSISNTGDVDSTLEFKRFFVTENILDSSLLNPVPIAGAALRSQAVVVPPSLESSLIQANGFSPSSISEGALKVVTAGTPVSS